MIITRCRKIVVIVGLMAICWTGAIPAEEPAVAFAKGLLAKAGVSRGIVSLPHCGDAGLALAFAREARLVVHAMSSDPKIVNAMREAASADGLLTRSLYAELGLTAANPLADDYVNLLVVADATDESLASLSADEILRVLVPETGVAIVGLPEGAPDRLEKGKLEKWAKAFSGAQTVIEKGPDGVWLKVVKSRKAGAVSWTHRLYDSSNNVVSEDTACAWPLMTQWFGRPFLGPVPVMLVSQGRLATVRQEDNGWRGVLELRDAHNGVLLWRRPLPNTYVAARTSGMVLLPDALFLAEGPNVLIFDPATGAEIGRVDATGLGAQVKWIAWEDGTLYVMAGIASVGGCATQTWKLAYADQPTVAKFDKCKGLGAYDIKTAKWLWTATEDNELLDDGLVGLCHGRLYYYVTDKHLACREAKSGKVVWENARAVEKVNQFGHTDTRGHVGALICTDKYIALYKSGGGCVVVSAVDGEPLWTPTGARMPAPVGPVFYRDLLVCKSATSPAFDAATGKPSNAFGKMSLGGGCGMFTFTPNLLCGQMGLTYDFKANRPLADASGNGPLCHKAPCLASSYVAEGLMLYGGVSCTCGYPVRGTIVQSPAPTELKEVDPWRRTTPTPQVKPVAADKTDWPTFRANNERSGATSANVPVEPAVIRWTWRPPMTATSVARDASGKPETPDPLESTREPVQATAAGSLVFVTGNDGSVVALDLTTGAPRWRFVTGGRLFAPATYADGRLFIGSGDGHVYSLEATTGGEIWRYRMAPHDRRIMVYGDLLSTWPVSGGVMVQDGVVYAAAGILDVDGTHVAALAADGALKWRNDASGYLDADRPRGVAACGYPAIGKGRLWIRQASYELTTGECRPIPVAKKVDKSVPSDLLERYTGVFAHNILLTGGRRFFEDQSAFYGDRTADSFNFLPLAEDATGKWPVFRPWRRCRTMPVWDDRHLVALPMAFYSPYYLQEEDLVCWDVPRMTEEMSKILASAEAAAQAQKKSVPRYLDSTDPDKTKGEKFEAPQQIWSAQKDHFIAAALAANAVVATHGTTAFPRPHQPANNKQPRKFAVIAYGRADGKVLWEVPLPGEPLMDGLSIARDGTVLVRLLDGGLVAVGAGNI